MGKARHASVRHSFRSALVSLFFQGWPDRVNIDPLHCSLGLAAPAPGAQRNDFLESRGATENASRSTEDGFFKGQDWKIAKCCARHL
jgi:hypothetical protein